MVKTHGFPVDFPLNQSNDCHQFSLVQIFDDTAADILDSVMDGVSLSDGRKTKKQFHRKVRNTII